jgi:hypothetical protein
LTENCGTLGSLVLNATRPAFFPSGFTPVVSEVFTPMVKLVDAPGASVLDAIPDTSV